MNTPKLDFFIPCIPPKATSQQKGAMRTSSGIRFFKKAHVKRAENDLISLLRPHAPSKPLEGPLSVAVTFVFPFRASEKKSIIAAGRHVPMTVRPDCSNIVKMLEDSMTTLRFWEDDAQNARIVVEKWWGEEPGIGITILPFRSITLDRAAFEAQCGHETALTNMPKSSDGCYDDSDTNLFWIGWNMARRYLDQSQA